MSKVLEGTLAMTVLASCGLPSGTAASARCKFYGPSGSLAANTSATFVDPVKDARAFFKEGKWKIAVVRDKYGRTVTPLSSNLDPVRQEISSTDDKSQSAAIWKTIMPKIQGRYSFIFLQEDVIIRKGESEQVNFSGVESPCFDESAFNYASNYNTEMLRLMFAHSGIPVTF